MKKILLYNCSPIVSIVLSTLSIPLQTVNQKDYPLELSSLLEGKELSDNNNLLSYFQDPMIVFCNLSDSELDSVLSILKSNQIQIDYKAILTPFNIHWTSSQLHDELFKEHQTINNKIVTY